MKFCVMVKSYNCYGGHTTLSKIGDFLLMGAGNFGSAINKLTVTLYLRNSGPPKKTLGELFAQHHRHRAALPKITFRKAKATVEIDIASELMDGRDWERSPRLSLPLFARGVEEIIRALSLIRKRLKTADDFHLEAFLAHCNAARSRIPASEDALQNLAAELESADKARRDAMSPWEKLGIDWEDFHPAARTILDDPFYWDCANDFSPNGNDTGADLLEDYRDWLRMHRHGEPVRFFERVAMQWGYHDIEHMDAETRDEAAVGLAFADIKLRGICDPQARQLALEAIERRRHQAEAALQWSHRTERLETLAMLEARLKSLITLW